MYFIQFTWQQEIFYREYVIGLYICRQILFSFTQQGIGVPLKIGGKDNLSSNHLCSLGLLCQVSQLKNCYWLSIHNATRSRPFVSVLLRHRRNKSHSCQEQLLSFPFPLWVGSFVSSSLNHLFWLVNMSHNEEIHMA